MKKNYTYPTIEILPCCAVTALCVSEGGETPTGLGGGTSGGNSYNDGRGPRRTPAF